MWGGAWACQFRCPTWGPDASPQFQSLTHVQPFGEGVHVGDEETEFSSSIPSLQRGLLGTASLGPSPTWLITIACSHCFFCKEVTVKLSRSKTRDQSPQ